MGTTVTDISDIKWLRDETGAGIMDARKALQETNGDREQAKKLLQERGAVSVAKRAERPTMQGVVEPYIHAGGQIGVLVELDSETDFVSRMADFKELAHQIALQVAATNPLYLSVDDVPPDEAAKLKAEGQFEKWVEQHILLEQPYIRDDSKTVKQLVQELGARTRENIVVRRFCRFQVGA
jgi:elongation factor Ts